MLAQLFSGTGLPVSLPKLHTPSRNGVPLLSKFWLFFFFFSFSGKTKNSIALLAPPYFIKKVTIQAEFGYWHFDKFFCSQAALNPPCGKLLPQPQPGGLGVHPAPLLCCRPALPRVPHPVSQFALGLKINTRYINNIPASQKLFFYLIAALFKERSLSPPGLWPYPWSITTLYLLTVHGEGLKGTCRGKARTSGVGAEHHLSSCLSPES